jgi:RNA-binding protein Musashi
MGGMGNAPAINPNMAGNMMRGGMGGMGGMMGGGMGMMGMGMGGNGMMPMNMNMGMRFLPHLLKVP